jgi:hypothetical protein
MPMSCQHMENLSNQQCLVDTPIPHISFYTATGMAAVPLYLQLSLCGIQYIHIAALVLEDYEQLSLVLAFPIHTRSGQETWKMIS